MSIEENKAVVGRWFTEFWGKEFNPAVVDELAAPDIRFEYSLHEPLRGRDAVRAFAEKFRAAFPDLNFWGTADLIAEGDYVVGQWEGGGTHTGEAFDDMPLGALPANTGKTMQFTGTTVLKVENGLITEEIGLDDGIAALQPARPHQGSLSRRGTRRAAAGPLEALLRHVAFSPVVGELDLAVLRPAAFSKALSELRFLFLTLLASSRGFRCSCALHVPWGGLPLTSCRRVSAVLTCDNVQLR